MERLSQNFIVQVHQFLLDLNACENLESHSRLIPQGLSRLIRCERAAHNVAEFGADRVIVPNPVPDYWKRFGSIMVGHIYEHSIFKPSRIIQPYRIESFGDRLNDPDWQKSVLYNEYYLAIGVRFQIGTFLFQAGSERHYLNCNRSQRDFVQKDRFVMELIGPHITRAWQITSELTRLRRERASPPDSGFGKRTLVVTRQAHITSHLTADLASLLTRYFEYPHFESKKLPRELGKWFREQLAHISSVDAMTGPPAAFHQVREQGTLIVRLACLREDSATLIFSETPRTAKGELTSTPQLTPREREVLQWLREGKRNREIGTILGLSPRTVGKHIENVFSKLGVETRTAAARAVVPPF